MSAVSVPAGELRALLAYDTLPEGCIAFLVTTSDFEPHLRLGEFAIIDPSDREPQHGELFTVAWMNGRQPGEESPNEHRALCEAYRREFTGIDSKPFSAWSVGSLRSRFTAEQRRRMVEEGRWRDLGWSNGP